MAQVTRSIELSASPEDVWAIVGGFQALPDWHPAVLGSVKELKNDTELRRLDLGGGAEILERSWGTGDGSSYGYEILEAGPLPVANYRATISVVRSGGGCLVVWSSTFESTGDGAEAAISGVYDAGLQSLKDRFGS